MLVCPIAAVNDRHAARGGKFTHRALGGMAHNDGIGVTAQHPRRVIKRLAFSYGCTLKPVVSRTWPPKRLKALPKLMRVRVDGSKTSSLEWHLEYRCFALAASVGTHAICHFKNTVDITSVKLTDPQDVMAGKLQSALSLLFDFQALSVLFPRCSALFCIVVAYRAVSTTRLQLSIDFSAPFSTFHSLLWL